MKMKAITTIAMLFALTIPAAATIGGAKPRGYVSPLVRSIMIQQGIYQNQNTTAAAPIIVTPVPPAPTVAPAPTPTPVTP